MVSFPKISPTIATVVTYAAAVGSAVVAATLPHYSVPASIASAVFAGTSLLTSGAVKIFRYPRETCISIPKIDDRVQDITLVTAAVGVAAAASTHPNSAYSAAALAGGIFFLAGKLADAVQNPKNEVPAMIQTIGLGAASLAASMHPEGLISLLGKASLIAGAANLVFKGLKKTGDVEVDTYRIQPPRTEFWVKNRVINAAWTGLFAGISVLCAHHATKARKAGAIIAERLLAAESAAIMSIPAFDIGKQPADWKLIGIAAMAGLAFYAPTGTMAGLMAFSVGKLMFVKPTSTISSLTMQNAPAVPQVPPATAPKLTSNAQPTGTKVPAATASSSISTASRVSARRPLIEEEAPLTWQDDMENEDAARAFAEDKHELGILGYDPVQDARRRASLISKARSRPPMPKERSVPVESSSAPSASSSQSASAVSSSSAPSRKRKGPSTESTSSVVDKKQKKPVAAADKKTRKRTRDAETAGSPPVSSRTRKKEKN